MGPLQGIRVIEMAGIGPAPFCGMLLADMGADVLRIDRLAAADLGFPVEPRFDILNRGKRAAAIDIKSDDGVGLVKRLVGTADILIEGFRAGVMERLGLGPVACLAINPRLVFGRMTGYGQSGPMKDRAGHDINYIGMSGALAAIGTDESAPVPPLNLVGDFGGGALYLAFGVLAALTEARTSGKGQVVDAAMVDGVASLMAMMTGLRQAGIWQNARGVNLVDGGAPYYTTYRTADGKFVAVGAIEQRFYQELLDRLGLDGAGLPDRSVRENWPALREKFTSIFAARTRDEWAAVFEHSDACVTPVLDMDECIAHPMHAARGNYVSVDGVDGPAPTPKFSRTPGVVRGGARDPRIDAAAALEAWGIPTGEIALLVKSGVLAG